MTTPTEVPALLPEQRDVDFAYRLALAEHRDLQRAQAEYGPASDVTKAARDSYLSAWEHFQSTKALYGLRPTTDEEATA